MTADPHSDNIRKELSRWKWFFFNQKYRFDLGHQFLAMVNFALLVIAASDKLRYYTSVQRTWVLVAAAVPLGFLGMWLVGFFLDRFVKYGQACNIEAVKRNPLWDEQKAYLQRIEARLGILMERTATREGN
ncbi:MAG: hypothetical protein KKH28_02340 [Elusimicrobia bacterium]|nr:hypothetical protein [Elusimicrobiota bacterium]